jgi:hypothetical protein
MKAQDFQQWTEITGINTVKLVCVELGVSRNTVQKWFVAMKDGEDVPVGLSVSLAMSALYHRIEPWDKGEPNE